MTVATFNDGWRAGYNDAKGGRPAVYTDTPPFGLAFQLNNGIGAACGVEDQFVDYAHGYVGGFAAKFDAPPTGPEPVTLGTLGRQIEKLRNLWLLGGGDEEDITAGLDPVAEQHYLLAIGALEQAQRFATLADLHQARALGEQRSTR